MQFVFALLFLTLLAVAFMLSGFIPTGKEMNTKERQMKAVLTLGVLAVPLVISLVLILFSATGFIKTALP